MHNKFQKFKRTALTFLGAGLCTTMLVKTSLAVAQDKQHTPLVIFDTDMGPDIDDVLALAMLHAYQKQGKIELAAVTISRNSDAGARFSDAINTFYKHPDIPIGIYYGSTNWEGNDNALYPILANSYPHDIEQPLPEGVDVQRSVLARAEQEQRRVIMIQVGFSGNISTLLDSPADAISPKSGMDLVKDNVDFLSIMATRRNSSQPEFNVEKDLASAKNVFKKWPKKMVITGGSTGDAILYPYESIENYFNYVSSHPVKAAYEYKNLSWHPSNPPFYNMRSWDLLSVLEAVEPENNYLKLSGPGRMTLSANGASTFVEGNGEHYLSAPDYGFNQPEKNAIVDRLVQLVSATPVPESTSVDLPSDTSEYFYQQANSGEYWWIINNTRRWLSKECGRQHVNAGSEPTLIAYSELEVIPRDEGPCPAVDPVDPKYRS
ncbi:nucleoside hydrolase [bacterium]|nr:nucleoside hydrolase [bacterium]